MFARLEDCYNNMLVIWFNSKHIVNNVIQVEVRNGNLSKHYNIASILCLFLRNCKIYKLQKEFLLTIR